MEIKQFNPKLIKHKSNIMIVGRCCTGKTSLVLDILKHMELKNGTIATSPNNFEYKNHYPNVNITDEFVGPLKNDEFNVIDSCGYILSQAMKLKLISKIIMDKEQTNIIASCYLQVRPEWLPVIDYVFILRETFFDHQKLMWKYFGGMFDSVKTFTTVLMEHTNDYGCLVIDIKNNNVYHYRSKVN